MNIKPYCTAPLTGLFLDVDGGIKFCCSGAQPIGNINENSLNDIYSSPKHKQLFKTIVEDGEPDDIFCQNCHSVEQGDPTVSQRYTFNTYHKIKNETQSLSWVDFRWTNQCNLSCRHCDTHFSSEWSKIRGHKIKNANRNYHETIFEEVEKNIDTIKCVNVLGGEPFLQKQNLRLLDIVSQNKNADIVFFTNLAIKLENNLIFEKLLTMDNNIQLMISIDCIEDQFEYVRAGADWNIVLENLELLKSTKLYEHAFLAPVFCLWTADSFQEYYEFADKHKIRVYIQQAVQVPNFGKTFLAYGHNEKVKERLIKKLELVNRKELITPLNQLKLDFTVENRSKDFLSNTLKVEKLVPPKKTFSELWPELYTLLKD